MPNKIPLKKDEVFLYHCDACGADVREDSDDYGGCPSCWQDDGESYNFVRHLEPDEEVPGAKSAIDLLCEEMRGDIEKDEQL